MHFKKAKVYTSPRAGWKYTFDNKESEFTYALSLGAEYHITDRWSVNTSLSYERTLTYYPLSVAFLSAGVRYSFSSPGWVKRALQ